MLSKTIRTLAATALLGASSLAAAQTAAPLGLTNSPAIERASAQLEDAGELRGPVRWIVGAAVLGLIIWGIIELTDDNERDFPTSP